MKNIFNQEHVAKDNDLITILKEKDEETLYCRVNRLNNLQKIKSERVLFGVDMELACI